MRITESSLNKASAVPLKRGLQRFYRLHFVFLTQKGMVITMNITTKELYETAKGLAKSRQLNEYTSAGAVSAALLTDQGNVYTGICIDAPCGMGFCAEHAAAASMLCGGETRIVKMVAVHETKGIIPPCGRCREFLYQLNHDNLDCIVVLEGKEVQLKELRPELWS